MIRHVSVYVTSMIHSTRTISQHDRHVQPIYTTGLPKEARRSWVTCESQLLLAALNGSACLSRTARLTLAGVTTAKPEPLRSSSDQCVVDKASARVDHLIMTRRHSRRLRNINTGSQRSDGSTATISREAFSQMRRNSVSIISPCILSS